MPAKSAISNGKPSQETKKKHAKLLVTDYRNLICRHEKICLLPSLYEFRIDGEVFWMNYIAPAFGQVSFF